MGEYLHQAYAESISTEYDYEHAYYDDYYDYYLNGFQDDDCFIDPSEYIPRIEGTELECGITFGSLNYLPILTSRVIENKRKYYLFDFIKVWSVNEKSSLSRC